MSILMYDLAGENEAVRFSPYCWRTKMALKHKGLAFEDRPWRFTEKDAIAFSGQTKVPVVVDEQTVITDSWAIASYLDRQYPSKPPLIPADSAGLSQFFKLWCEQSLHPVVLRVIVMDLFHRLHPDDQAYFRESREKRFGCTLEDFIITPEEGRARLQPLLAPVRDVLESAEYLGGDSPIFADYVLFAVFQWARVSSPADLLQNEERIRQWFERLLGIFDGYAAGVPAAG